jgi:sugar fermentation stimulation protein A
VSAAVRFSEPLVRGRLIRRYQRFLADVLLDTGETVTAACPNTGSMLGLSAPGSIVWLSTSNSPTRKYRHTWELVEARFADETTLVGINSSRPNHLVADALGAGGIPELQGYPVRRREVRYGLSSRVDLLLECAEKGRCYVEVKNVHMMRRPGVAEFPDSVTERGAKHLAELARMVQAGNRAFMLFLIQRADATSFEVARDIDPAYGLAFDAALASGVETLAYSCRVTPEEIAIVEHVPVRPAEMGTTV